MWAYFLSHKYYLTPPPPQPFFFWNVPVNHNCDFQISIGAFVSPSFDILILYFNITSPSSFCIPCSHQILGLICPSNNPSLTTNNGTAASSAWVIAIRIAGIKTLPSIINACILSEWHMFALNLTVFCFFFSLYRACFISLFVLFPPLHTVDVFFSYPSKVCFHTDVRTRTRSISMVRWLLRPLYCQSSPLLIGQDRKGAKGVCQGEWVRVELPFFFLIVVEVLWGVV